MESYILLLISFVPLGTYGVISLSGNNIESDYRKSFENIVPNGLSRSLSDVENLDK